VHVPESLAPLRRRPEGAAWLASLPDLIAGCVERWDLDVGAPYAGGTSGWVAPVTTGEGARAVLKVQWPHRESEHEADALRWWDGHGAVRLLDDDPGRHALLLERCVPGTELAASTPEVAVGVIIGLMRQLCTPAAQPFDPLEDECRRWADELPQSWERAGRPFERSLVDRAVGLLDELGPTQGPQVLVNQDLHGDNVLAAEREPWLVIDPKPLVGELEFAPTPVFRSAELGHTREAVRRRLDRCCDELELDRERTRGWAFAHTMAWAFQGDHVLPAHLQTARWLVG
jgi:streptomycin 6-kinase